ncbi:tellurite resistance TerB family protein [Thioclava sp. BHET1]|nr:tellurite resistance TerB family protein [Thioclava sp. BHET1]
MSFVKTLATLAVGFAAAKGAQKFSQMGGLQGMKEALGNAGKPGGMADQMGDMAEKMGVPGGRDTVRDLFSKFGTQAASATGATEAGLGSLMGAFTGAASAGAGGLGGMLSAVTGGTPAEPAMEDQAKLMIRAMIQAAKADGQIDDQERQTILDHLSDASDDEIAFVKAELDAPIDVSGLANDTAAHMKAQVYSAALMAITVDTEAEKQYLANLAAALGLEAQKVAEIHKAMGKPLV